MDIDTRDIGNGRYRLTRFKNGNATAQDTYTEEVVDIPSSHFNKPSHEILDDIERRLRGDE